MNAEQCRRVLGVAANADGQTIRQAYLDLARVWHPDRFQSDERLRLIAEDHLREVNEAYAALKNYRPPVDNYSQQSERTARTQAPKPAASHAGNTTATEEPPPPPPKPQSPPEWARTWTASAPQRRANWFDRLARALSNRVAHTAVVIAALTLPLVVAWQAIGLVRVPVLDTNLLSPQTFQPKILTPMRIIDPASDVRGAADALTEWARGDAIDLWKPVHSGGTASGGAISPPADGRKTAIEPQRHVQRSAATETKRPAPADGTELIATGRLSGVGELHLANHTGLEAIVKLVGEGRTQRAVYVTPKGNITLRSIPVGVYELHVDLGTELDQARLQFQRDRVTPTPLGPFQFLQITSEKGVSGSHYEVVLNPRT